LSLFARKFELCRNRIRHRDFWVDYVHTYDCIVSHKYEFHLFNFAKSILDNEA